MTRVERLLRRVGVAAIAIVCAACGLGRPPPGTPLPYAAGSFAVWAPQDAQPTRSARGLEVDAFAVRAGELVRLEGDGAAIDVGERTASAGVETWSSRPAEGGVVVFRAGPFTKSVLVPRGAVRRVFVGQASDPGYEWFALEREVLAWAEGPLDAPFPEVAPRERIDRDGFAGLDAALALAVGAARDKAAAMDEARSVRRVAGLRALRALEPASGYPYFLDTEVRPRGAPPSRDLEGRRRYRVTPAAPLEYAVTGPALLHVWSRGERVDDDQAEIDVRVLEGTRVRAASGASMPRRALTAYDDATRDDTVALRRAVLHVPPGAHVYRVEAAGAPAWVHALRAEPMVHVEDAITGEPLEARQIARAREGCGSPDRAALCAMAMALAGEDAGVGPRWTATLAASPSLARAAAEMLAAGGPRDPVVALEVSAARGDTAALARLGAMADKTIDGEVREAWARAVARGTRWVVSPHERAPETWRTILRPEGRGADCAQDRDADWPEVGADGMDLPAVAWHGANAIELLAVAPCDAAGPVRLEVDGAPLDASPAGPLARWHVRVHGDTARVRRLDGGTGHVYAMPRAMAACGAHWAQLRSARPASEQPELTWGPTPSSPGIEVWTRAGATRGEVTVAPRSGPGSEIRIAVGAAHASLTAVDERGVRWQRVARVPLPAWAAGGARVRGGDDVAVRAIVRASRDPGESALPAPGPRERDPVPLDDAEVTALGRAIRETPRAARGPLHLKRALLLAHAGAMRGALADARAAKALGAEGPSGEDPVALARAEAARAPSLLAPLPEDTRAYGVEPDFDPGARRCADADGPRARIARALAAVDARHETGLRAFDPALAARAAEAAEDAPLDPRAETLLRRAVAGSRWRTLRDLGSDAIGVARPRTQKESPVSGAGELRAHALAGGPFAEGTYVAVTAERPAKARLGAIPPSAAARADVVCVARAPEEAGRACPLSIRVGDGEPRRPELGEDGRATVSLDLAAGSPAVLEMAMGPGPGKWVALARVVFDREVPGAKLEEGVGWVLEPPHVERRFLLAPGEPLTVHGVTGLVRVDASSEPGERARLIASAGGRERVLPADGSAATLAVTAGAPLVLRASGGAVTVAVAQRERLEADDDGGEEVDPSPPPSRTPRADPPVAGVALDLASPAVTRDIAERSPPPLSGLESSLGTLATRTFAVYGTLREGLPSVPNGDADGYAGAAVDYLRRIESLDLWTHAGVLGRVRRGTPTGGATATLYEDADRIHTRVTGTVDAFTQSVAGQGVVTVKPRGFVEYSLRATRTFFVLPRLGYDGAYSTLSAPARSLANVDDDVHNPYRVKRPTFAFAQALLWWTPYFNDIFYLRSRATYDPVAGEVSHLSSRPGFFAAFGDVDLSGFVDTTWYAPSSSLRSSERLDATAGFKWAYTLWRNLGSFALQPGASGAYRVTDGGWQVAVYVNLLTSYRRGLRDYSSLDLDFPEQLGGSIPWRGATPGGYR